MIRRSGSGSSRHGHNARRVAALVVALSGLLTIAAASADCPLWSISAICPDEYPGPPDCFACQLFGSTVVYEDQADMDWEGWEVSMYGCCFGYFDVGEGVNVYNDHYNCEWSPYDIPVEIRVWVGSSDCGDVRFDNDYITCTGDY